MYLFLLCDLWCVSESGAPATVTLGPRNFISTPLEASRLPEPEECSVTLLIVESWVWVNREMAFLSCDESARLDSIELSSPWSTSIDAFLGRIRENPLEFLFEVLRALGRVPREPTVKSLSTRPRRVPMPKTEENAVVLLPTLAILGAPTVASGLVINIVPLRSTVGAAPHDLSPLDE